MALEHVEVIVSILVKISAPAVDADVRLDGASAIPVPITRSC